MRSLALILILILFSLTANNCNWVALKASDVLASVEIFLFTFNNMITIVISFVIFCYSVESNCLQETIRMNGLLVSFWVDVLQST